MDQLTIWPLFTGIGFVRAIEVSVYSSSGNLGALGSLIKTSSINHIRTELKSYKVDGYER